jgi:lipopolysaccharide export system protein LptC
MAETRPIPLPLPPGDRAGRPRAGLALARREAPDPARIARRRRAVQLAKRVLPLAAFAALALVALWPQIAGIEEGVRVAYRKPSLDVPAGAASVVEPRFQGTDERGRPYTVSADSALQPAGSETIELARPRGDVTLEDGAWVLLESATGSFRRDTRMLGLVGEVALFHDSGFEVRTEAAEVDLRAGTARGDRPVAAQGPAGTLDAVGFEIIDRGDVIVFGGPARLVLTPSERPAAERSAP